MFTGKLVFTQAMDHLPLHTFRRCVQRYDGNRYIKNFSCQEQFRCMAFAQFTYRESLRDIEACLNAQSSKLYHMGIRSSVARSTLADANERRDWRIYADFAQSLIQIARQLYAGEDLGLELDNTVYALDATTIDLCLAVFPWAHFRQAKAAVKLHTLLDLRGNIPSFIHISDGKLHDVNVLDLLLPEPGAFYVMDRGYLDYERLYQLDQAKAFFVIRSKSNLQFRSISSRPVDKETGLRCDQTIKLTGYKTSRLYPDVLRRIKSFFGTSENAVKTQVWVAVSVYVLVAIIKKRLDIKASLYSILQMLSVTVFETMPIDQLLTGCDQAMINDDLINQLNLFD